MDDQSDDSNTPDDAANPVFTEDEDDSGFDHPDDDEIETTRVPEVNSADDAVDGDESRKERLQSKADELRQKAEELEAAEDSVDSDTPVSVDEEVDPYEQLDQAADGGTEAGYAGAETADSDEPTESIDQASSSVFDDDEAAAINDEFGDDFDLKPVEDIPDDFDFEAQDTKNFGVADEEMVIEHNGTYFELTHPEGVKEDQFWSAMQGAREQGPVAVFDVMIEYVVNRPEDIRVRMERENWTGFAKAGLATKCMSFVGMDELQDF